MSQHHGRRWAGAATVLSLAACSIAYVHAARAVASPAVSGIQSVNSSPPFAAAMRIRQSRLGADGRELPLAIAMSFHVERGRSSHGWTTAITLDRIEGADAPSSAGGVLENPFLVTRVEIDDGGAGMRLFDRRGQPIRQLTRREQERLGLASGQDALAGWTPGGPPGDAIGSLTDDIWPADVAAPGLVERRRRAIQTSFGPLVERRQGLNRHVRVNGDETVEAFVDPDLALPVDVQTRRGSALVSRTTIVFERAADGSLARKRVRSERVIPGQNGARDVLDADLVRATPGIGGAR